MDGQHFISHIEEVKTILLDNEQENPDNMNSF